MGSIYFGSIVFSCLLSTKPSPRFLLICFAWEIKSFYQSSLGNEVDFRDIMNVSQISWLKIKISKTETWFSDKRAPITTTLISSCHWKTLISFCLQNKTWKCIFNNNELYQNLTEKQIMPPKTTVNWLFNDICYLLIACFDLKIGIFQQIVVRVYYFLKVTKSIVLSIC